MDWGLLAWRLVCYILMTAVAVVLGTLDGWSYEKTILSCWLWHEIERTIK